MGTLLFFKVNFFLLVRPWQKLRWKQTWASCTEMTKLMGLLCKWLTRTRFQSFPAKLFLVFFSVVVEEETFFVPAWKHPFKTKDNKYWLAPICAPTSLICGFTVVLYHEMVCVYTSSRISSIYRDFLCTGCEYNTRYAQYHKCTDEENDSSPIGIL